MRIEPNNGPLRPDNLPASQLQAGGTGSPPDAADLATFRNLAHQLETIPLARPEKVEPARVLASDPAYPSDAILDKVADLLAGNL